VDALLLEKLENLPTSPGCYLFKDRAGKVIYVGKALSLRSRVRSYFGASSGDSRAFIPLLDHLLGDLEVVITGNEKEALILENTLIKKHRPRFNVMLRDDKAFIHLRLDAAQPYPRLEIVRRPRAGDSASTFGPYSSAASIRETLRIVNRHFQLRTCTDGEFRNRTRPCLEHMIGRCPAPCVYEVPVERYAQSVREVQLFLGGKGEELTSKLEGRMRAAAAAERFEEAARVRDQLRAVERSLERQRVVEDGSVERDVIGVHRAGPRLAIAVLLVRQGRLTDARTFHFSKQEFPTEELLSSFLGLYYDGGASIPRQVLLPLAFDGMEALRGWLADKGGRAVQVLVPRRGEKLRVVEMASANAEQAAKEELSRGDDLEDTLARLERKLGLSKPPRVIECYDISGFQGTESVGSGVCFVDGHPDKSRYRRYRIRAVEGQDDFAMLYEVLGRRLRKGKVAGDLPDLLVIDGGKGQLNVALAALRDSQVSGVDVISLAKSRSLEARDSLPGGGIAEQPAEWQAAEVSANHSPERVFLPRVKDPVILKQNTSELFLLTRLRDEAHRFAITYHRKLRDRRTLRSALDDIPGIGAARRRALLQRFGSLKGVREASASELTEVPGISLALADRIAAILKGDKPQNVPAN
jgi:excinuclease ABC subunit C